jgi:hypothetical protein
MDNSKNFYYNLIKGKNRKEILLKEMPKTQI